MLMQSSITPRASSISIDEFYNAFKRVWISNTGPGGGKSPGVGIAVSGGVDSMALATLCVKLNENPNHHMRPRFRAFVVDHQARPESDREAVTVAKHLQRMGLIVRILTPKWPSKTDPANIGSFETQARKLRYRALGTACREGRIRHLLLAHHSDDQAETMLMKTAYAGEHINSVQPMGDSAVKIPECNGLHGVHESGFREFQADFVAYVHGDYQWHNIISQASTTEQPGIQYEDGGIKLHRPLMSFPKERLEATCHEHDIQWQEDQTNRDVTLTRRNAVRVMLEKGRLPQSLGKQRLLMMAKKMTEKAVSHETRAQRLVIRTKILSLDLRSGRLVVRLPSRIRAFDRVPEPFVKNEMSALRTTATMHLTKLLSIVSPNENIDFSTVHAMTEIVYPELLGASSQSDEKETAFNIAGVLVRRIPAPIETIATQDAPIHYQNLDRTHAWSFKREPFRRSEPPPKLVIVHRSSKFEPQRYFRLWDGRYWFRLTNRSGVKLIVRPFREADLKIFEESMPSAQFQELKAELKEAAPGVVRWTMPAIAEATIGERPLALPTLRCMRGVMPRHWRENLHWEFRYKKINVEEFQGKENVVG